MATRLRALGYTRVSTDNQHTRPEDDKARIEAACLAYDYDLVEVIHEVDGTSGKVPLADRPKGARIAALLAARAPEVDVLIVTNLDRLSRESDDGIGIIRSVIPNGRRNPVKLVSLDDHIDLTTASGRLFAKFKILMSEFERELIGERTHNALAHKRRTGAAYGRTPYGWDRAGREDCPRCTWAGGAGKAPDHSCRLVPNDGERVVLDRMRAERAAGVNDHAIAAALNGDGILGKRGGRWQAVTVYRILAQADEIGADTSHARSTP